MRTWTLVACAAVLALPVADAFAGVPAPAIAGVSRTRSARASAASVQMSAEGTRTRLARKFVALFSALCVGGAVAPQGARARTMVSSVAAVVEAPERVERMAGAAKQEPANVALVGGDRYVVAAGNAAAEPEAAGSVAAKPAPHLLRLQTTISRSASGVVSSLKAGNIDGKDAAKAATAVSAAGLVYVISNTGKGKSGSVKPAAAQKSAAATPPATKEEADPAAALLAMKKEEMKTMRIASSEPSVIWWKGGTATKLIGDRDSGYQTTTISKS